MADNYPTIALEKNTGPLGPRWLITIDVHGRGWEGGVEGGVDEAAAVATEMYKRLTGAMQKQEN